MYKLFIYLFTAFAFSQSNITQDSTTYKRKVYLEVCSTMEISMCGNYFEQNLMRDPFLIELNERNFLKSYDTVFCLNYKLLKEVNDHIKKYNKDDSLSIIYPNKFLLKLNKFLKKEKLKEKSKNAFKYIPLKISFKVEKTERSKICVINPNFRNKRKDSLFLTKDVIIVYINNMSIDSSTVYKKKILHVDKKGNVVRSVMGQTGAFSTFRI